MSANYKGVNFDNQTFRPKDLGVANDAGFPDGRLAGCNITESGLDVTVGTGWLMLKGREVQLVTSKTITLDQAYTGYAMIYAQIDLSKTQTTAEFEAFKIDVKYGSNLSDLTLTKGEINSGSDLVYEAELAIYALASGDISNIVRKIGEAKAVNGIVKTVIVPAIQTADGTATVNVYGVTANNTVITSAADVSFNDVVDNGVRLYNQATNMLTFKARFPAPQTTFNILILNNAIEG